MVSSKGGVGKTTTAVLIAGELVAAGYRVILIDADPNQPLKAWAELRPLPAGLRVVIDASAETILDTIDAARRDADMVIVDLEGTATDRMGFAIVRSDLVLIPLQSSLLDAAEAARAVKLVHRMGKVADRAIVYRVVFTRMSPALRERTAGDIDRQFEAAEVPVLPVRLIDRAAYRLLFSIGGTLQDLIAADVSGLSRARENSLAFAEAVLAVLRGEDDGRG
jgi:chromosome partitioning protein